jgi:hypothetical protein
MKKKPKTSHSNQSSHIEDNIMEYYERKPNLKNNENPRFYAQNKPPFLVTYPSSLDNFGHMVT